MIETLIQPRSFNNHLKRSVRTGPSGWSYVHYDIGSEWDARTGAFVAAQEAALRIYENYREPLYIPLSGGIDSECQARSFIEREYHFTL
jgi:hypothetical protein